jgi:CheY-like chemotaxis protein
MQYPNDTAILMPVPVLPINSGELWAMPPRVLLVEDEAAIADAVTYALATDGFEPVWCATGAAALEAMGKGPIALAILDIGLPDINGFDLFRRLTAASSVPVIFLTARSAEVDRIVGLEMGADDYISNRNRILAGIFVVFAAGIAYLLHVIIADL